MRSRLMIAPPAFSVIASIRPSTCSGTPVSMCFGGVPSRAGQFLRTRSWLAPMPPDVTITACALSSNSPDRLARAGRARARRRSAPGPSPRTPSTTPPVTRQLVDPVAELEGDQPALHARRAPAARTAPPRRPRPPRDVEARHRVAVADRAVAAALGPAHDREEADALRVSHARFSPAAKSTYASAHLRGQWSSGRSNPAVPIQSCSASSQRVVDAAAAAARASSTKNSPPNDQNAWPPSELRLLVDQDHARPASASSAVAARPASPAPTTITSASGISEVCPAESPRRLLRVGLSGSGVRGQEVEDRLTRFLNHVVRSHRHELAAVGGGVDDEEVLRLGSRLVHAGGFVGEPDDVSARELFVPRPRHEQLRLSIARSLGGVASLA